MRDVLRKYQPDSIEDLTALNALYRPGPIQGGMIDDFIDRKHGRKKVEYELPELKDILEETLGVIVYQEQVMQIANRLAGYSLGEADLLRRAMGKKKPEEMAQQRERFVQGAVQRKLPSKKIEKIFDLMAQFAGYGFNKSHSAAYALLAYHTAYLKTHYPIESHGGAADFGHRQHGRRGEVHQRMPGDGNRGRGSGHQRLRRELHTAWRGHSLRAGCQGSRMLGETPSNARLWRRERNSADSSRFTNSAKTSTLRLLNKRVLESLMKSGALDSLGRRAQLMAVLDRAMDRAQKTQRDAESGQHGLFGVFQQEESEANNDKLPNIPDWDEQVRLAAEKEILGFFISGHPLEKYKDKLDDLQALTVAEIAVMTRSTGKDETIATAGIIGNLRVQKSKKGDYYAQATLEDMSGSIDMIVFPEAFKRLGEKVKLEVPVLVRAGVRIEEGANPKITAAEIMPPSKKPRFRCHAPSAFACRSKPRAKLRWMICTRFFRSAGGRREYCSMSSGPAISWW